MKHLLSRRKFLAAGAATVGGAALGLPRMSFSQERPKRNLIMIFARGGWDVTYALDPKPSGLATIAVPAGAVVDGPLPYYDADATEGMVVGYFQAHTDVSAVVRGITVRSISHTGCTKRMLTGTASDLAPDLGVLTGHTHAPELPIPYMVLGSTAFTGPFTSSGGRLGATNQLVGLLDPEKAYRPPSFIPTDEDDAAIAAYVKARAERVRAQRGQFGANQKTVQDFLTSIDKSRQLRPYSEGMGQQGFAIEMADQLSLAIRLIQEGVS